MRLLALACSLVVPASVLVCCASPPPPAPPVATASTVTASVAPAASSAPAAAAASTAGPPVAPVREVSDVYFGTTVVDPYRWMESASPELDAWMKGQSDHTRTALDALPLRGKFFERVQQLDNAGTRVRGISAQRGLVLSMEADVGTETYKLCARANPLGPRRVLLDPEKLRTDERAVSIDYWSASPDGRHVAFGMSQAGSEMATLRVVEVKTGKLLSDSITRARYAGPRWLDDHTFVYKRDRLLPADAPANERFTRSRMHLHRLGQDPEKDEPVFGHGVIPEITVPDEAFPSLSAPAQSSYLIAVLAPGVQPEVTLYYAPRRSFAGAKTPWKKLVDRADKVTDFDLHGDEIFLLSHQGAPRGKLLRLNLKEPDLAKAEVVIPESEAVVTRTGLSKDALYVRQLDAGIGKLVRVPFKTRKPEPVALGVEGSVSGFAMHESLPGALVRVESWTSAPRVVRFDPDSGKSELTPIIPPSSVASGDVLATEVRARSEDGTMVPLSIVHHKDVKLDRQNPTYLNGYASYGNVYGPYFEPMDLAWLERGGVLAFCHARGGGELGEDWHNAGKLATKPNTVKDFIACAQHLIDQGYTSPAHLAGQGTSAGGILIGGAITRRPDLFAAAVIRVGMVNALRFEQIPIGPFNTSEFGSVATPEGFAMLRAIDAYHAVEKGKAYPAVMLDTGITDPRVSPWQMAKMAARLQASSSSGNPVLLRVDYGAGHGIGTSKVKYEEEVADIFAFLSWRLGGR